MKFHPDLAREILLEVEKLPPSSLYASITDDNFSDEEVSYHINMLGQAGLVEVRDDSTFGKYEWKVRSLTYEGHQFLERVRDDTLWSKTKAFIKAQSIPFTMVVIKAAAAKVLEDEFGLKV